MAYNPLETIDSSIIARAKKIRLLCFDVDGTLTDGRLQFSGDKQESKTFHAHDGQGITLLRKRGISIAFVTARNSQVALNRAAELEVEGFIHIKNKSLCVQTLCEKHGVSWDEVAFMGDDIVDIGCLQRAGLSVAPASAHPLVLDYVHWQTSAEAGQGAARQLCDVILAAQGHWDHALQEFLQGFSEGGSQ